MAKSCKVYCKTLNKWFKTIKAAAKFAKANDWSMSKKMDVSGVFVDEEGREYIRQTPMETKNKYPDTGSRVLKTWTRKRTKKKEQYFPMIDELLNQKPEKKKIVFGDYPIVVQRVIEEHAKEMLRMGTPFDKVKAFLLDAGCKTITINLVEDKNAK